MFRDVKNYDIMSASEPESCLQIYGERRMAITIAASSAVSIEDANRDIMAELLKNLTGECYGTEDSVIGSFRFWEIDPVYNSIYFNDDFYLHLQVVDGYFLYPNFVGKRLFAAVNFIMPFLMVVGAMGFMFGTGGSALIARIMGEGRREKAQEIFSLLIAATFVSGLVIAVISILFLPQIAAFLGAKGEMLADCIRYGRIILVALPF